MKKFIKFSLMLVATAIFATSCNCYKKMGSSFDTIKIECSPEVLALNNGKVDAEISVEIPAKYFNKKALLRVTPVFVYEGGEVAADPIMLQGEGVSENFRVVNFSQPTSFKESVSFKYAPEMRMGSLQLRVEANCKCSDCADFVLINAETGAVLSKSEVEAIESNPKSAEAQAILSKCGFKVADGVNTLQSDLKYADLMVMMKDNFKRVTTTVETADLQYGISSSVLSGKSLKSSDVAKFKALVEANSKNDRAKQTLYANGYASPDGPENFNDKLSKSRSESGKSAMVKMLKGYGVEVDAAAYGEDWDGFKKLVEASDIEDKHLILKVLSMYDSSTQREREIKNLAAVFGELKSDVLPQLRRAQMSNKIDMTGKSDEEMMAVVEAKKFGELNVEEILHICANLKVDNKSKVALLEYATKEFGDFRAYNNLGVTYARMGKNKEAMEALNASIKAGAKGAATSKNMALMNLIIKKVGEAEKFAKGADEVAKSALAAAKGNYTPATKSMKGYNAAIAYTQLGNYTAAKSALANVKTADADYLGAVIASLEGDVKTAGSKLQAAVKKNKNLAKKAATDVNLKNLYKSGFSL
ncbi:MAG: hypothetical protein SNG14_07560 [Rikenellaceae bacterium]